MQVMHDINKYIIFIIVLVMNFSKFDSNKFDTFDFNHQNLTLSNWWLYIYREHTREDELGRYLVSSLQIFIDNGQTAEEDH